MTTQHHPGEENILSLRQGIDLIRRLDPESFAGSPEDRSAVGSQFRHCIDFYECFLRGLPGGRIDYNRRERDARVASEPSRAIESIERIIEAMAGLGPEILDRDILVRLDRVAPEGGSANDAEGWCRSTVLRELQFLFSHTIHHYALVANLLAMQGFELGKEFSGFGVAPSTQAHWKQNAPVQ